jgi:hypothetical protein
VLLPWHEIAPDAHLGGRGTLVELIAALGDRDRSVTVRIGPLQEEA